MKTIKRTVMYRGERIEDAYPVVVLIDQNCPVCGGPRGESFPYTFFEGDQTHCVDRWINPCGHIDSYKDCLTEHYRIAAKVFDENPQDTDHKAN